MAVALLAALLSLGCVHRIEVSALPAGATIAFNGSPAGRSPVEVEVRPFKPRELTVSLPGYRTATVELSRTGPMSFVADALTLRWLRALGLTPYRPVEVRLVREHGGIGTWDPSELE